ncbi:YdeI family protein [Cognatishimia sp. F0-27]|uniref:YdeI/OmpD-associated family protein n=1 Tax=Cognatishimia sp. F0-27 TaxID=2816855 RepID=UPI001D0C2C67|nr:YdeI/OmpD-associated family protein [Cognatishimia sp. F0-27]MCC1495045.1 YdeI/OmpD-associated family protein [Cognatishimia sp. F0-27]
MTKGIPTERFEKVEVASAQELRAWLSLNHSQTENVWLVTYKKHVGDKYVSVEETLDAIISFGWVDGIRRKLDDDRTMQVIGPRHRQAWAKSYKDRAARLIKEGRMQAPGFASVEAGKQSGLWDYWADVDALIEPDDLRTALAASPAAKTYYDQTGESYRRNLLRWIKLAKTDVTRQKRIAQVVDFSLRGDRVPQM